MKHLKTTTSFDADQSDSSALTVVLQKQKQSFEVDQAISVENLLTQHPELLSNPEAILDLIYQEVMLREQKGESPTLEEYTQRFPDLADQLAAQFEIEGILGGSLFESLAPDRTTPHVPDFTPDVDLGPNYEMLDTLGRGGMGVVYKARHRELNRIVALKMILAGTHAGPEHLSRFKTEAEAVARLQHPGIVQIFEISEHEGMPFLSLEFCSGGGLENTLRDAPIQTDMAVRIVEHLAKAVQVAHDANIIHRDLKPANVLLDEKGIPKITDFGLAKKLDEVGETQTGAIMGTPSYMAPEQAKGDVREMGPGVDIYALGAILYECLTGRPPFLAADVMNLLQQVMHQEPVPPRQLQATIPQDLETICLKCLQKKPGERYATAQDLTDELRRYREGKPILARPISRWERAGKWVKRNPVVAGLLTAVILVLMIGVSVSTYFWFQASQRSIELGKKNQELITAVEKGENAIVTGALSPLAERWEERESNPLTKQEVDALWRLADYSSPTSTPIGLRFVDLACQTASGARQLGKRATPALLAAVGLNLNLRTTIEERLIQSVDDDSLPLDHRVDLALATVKLGDLSSKAASILAPFFVTALDKVKQAIPGEKGTKDLIVEALPTVSASLSDEAIQKQIQRITDWMSEQIDMKEVREMLKKGIRPPGGFRMLRPGPKRSEEQQTSLARGGAALISGLKPNLAVKESAQLADALLKGAPERNLSGSDRQQFLAALTSLAAFQDRQSLKKSTSRLLESIRSRQAGHELSKISTALATLIKRMDQKDGRRIGLEALQFSVRAMTQADSVDACFFAAKEMSPLLSVLPKEDVVRDVDKSLEMIWTQLSRTTSPRERPMGYQSVKFIGRYASDAKAIEMVKKLESLVKKPSGNFPRPRIGSSFGDSERFKAMAELGTASASKEVLNLLGEILKTTRDILSARELSESLVGLAHRTEPEVAIRSLMKTMTQAKSSTAKAVLAKGISEVSLRLNPSRRAQLLAEAIPKSHEFYGRKELAAQLALVADHLNDKTTIETVQMLLQSIKESWQSDAVHSLLDALGVLAKRLPSKQATKQAEQLLLSLKAGTDSPGHPSAMARAIGFLSVAMNREDAQRLCDESLKTLLALDRRAVADIARRALGIAGLLKYVDSKKASQVAQDVAKNLIPVLKNAEPEHGHKLIVQALIMLTPSVEKGESQRVCSQIYQVLRSRMLHHKEEYQRPFLAELLARFAPCVGKQEQFQIAGHLIELIAKLRRKSELLPTVKEHLKLAQLSPENLIELLKHPTCIGATQRVILNALGEHYQRKFANRWEVVHHLQKIDSKLDLPRLPTRLQSK